MGGHMSRFFVWQKSRWLCLGLAVVFGLISLVGLLMVMDLAHSPRWVLAESPTIRYVAPEGDDSDNECSRSDHPCATIQHAVDEADAGDEVRVATGVYTDVHLRPSIDSTSVVTQVAYISKTLTVRGGYTTTDWSTSSPISYPTTLDAQRRGRVLYITGRISPTMEGLRMTGGYVKASGGGIYSRVADLVLINSIVTDNVSDGINWGDGLGGGMYIRDGNVILNEAQIISNSASYKGGGICLWGNSVTLSGGQISHNIAKGPSGWDGGGGMFILGNATLNKVQVISNTGRANGGGLYVYLSDVTLSEVQIVDNSAPSQGGGVFIWTDSDVRLNGGEIIGNSAGWGGGVANGGNFAQTGASTIAYNLASQVGGGVSVDGGGRATFSGAQIISNTAGQDGGGIFVHQSTANATLTNSVVSQNQAHRGGSGAYIKDGSLQLMHTTIARNSGGDGSGIHVAGADSTVALTNTILVSHTVGITVATGNTATLEATLWGAGDWANLTDWGGAGAIHTGAINLWGDPVFIDPDTGDYHIDCKSAAMDAGIEAGVTEDIDGDPRPLGDGYDLGADEFFWYRFYLPLVMHNWTHGVVKH